MRLNNFITIVLFAVFYSISAHAILPAEGSCYWEGHDAKLYTATFTRTVDLGTLNIPRDAPLGTVIGSGWVDVSPNTSSMDHLSCFSRPGITTSIDSGSVVNNISVAGQSIPAGSVYSTNIPGVGIVFKSSTLDLTTTSGTPPYFPYAVRVPALKTFNITTISVNVLLVKTGVIAMGSQQLKSSSQIKVDGADVIEKMTVTGTIIRSECVLPTTSKQITVPMGNISLSELKTTNDQSAHMQSFEIPLTNCVSVNTANKGNQKEPSYVNLSLSGNAGSAIVNSSSGVLGLNSQSTASGVGVQILQEGGAPMPLGKSVQMKKVTDGAMSIGFDARYVKTNDAPTPGSANASATFTITYK